MSIAIGDKLPSIEVSTTRTENLNLSDFTGSGLVLYFYPKDNTPGCTTQGQAFRDAYAQFQKLGYEIVGVSRESIKSHTNFINKHEFPFDLISDPDETLCKMFDVIKEKKMYGKTFLGIERSTFIFDQSGKLTDEIRKVKVKGHIDDVLARISS